MVANLFQVSAAPLQRRARESPESHPSVARSSRPASRPPARSSVRQRTLMTTMIIIVSVCARARPTGAAARQDGLIFEL